MTERSAATGARRLRARGRAIDLTDGARPQRRRVDRVIAVLAAAAVAAAAVVIISDAVSGAVTTVAGALQPAEPATLDFPSTWTVGSVLVHAGEHVRAGQVLAEQADEPALAGVVAADLRALAADHAALAGARTVLAAARSALAAVQPAGATGRSPAGATGRSPAGATGRSPAGAPSATSAAATSAAATVSPAAGADAASGETPAAASLAVDQAEAAIGAATAQLGRDRQAEDAATLVAPRPGWVVAVDGAPGDSAGPSGVRTATLPVVAPPGATLSLLPSAAPAANGSAGGSPPMLELAATPGPATVVADLPQSLVGRVTPSTWATVEVPAAGRALPARLAAVGTTPGLVDGRIVYPATFVLDDPVPGGRVGMSADVHLHRLR